METSGNFGGPIVSAISTEATLWYVTLSNPSNEALTLTGISLMFVSALTLHLA